VSCPSYEELTVFAAAGAVTERIRFLSNILIAPARSAAELAKQAATVDQLTNGRLTLGLGVGCEKATTSSPAGHSTPAVRCSTSCSAA
jgi:alkanesulfonate monooxygenase SsuD/methylene tetrahydromethanopterin reductase-like flavin-dependent oxidoreductase (luciferase family)